MSEQDDRAKCRGCGMILRGRAYCFGGAAFNPITGEQCKVNFYGGFVCSPGCDEKSSLELERDQPGHSGDQKRLGCFSRESFNRNWGSK